MDGTMTDGRKGIAYLRDHFAPALDAERRAVEERQHEHAPDRAERFAVSPAPV
jgi:hypothetical protein